MFFYYFLLYLIFDSASFAKEDESYINQQGVHDLFAEILFADPRDDVDDGVKRFSLPEGVEQTYCITDSSRLFLPLKVVDEDAMLEASSMAMCDDPEGGSNLSPDPEGSRKSLQSLANNTKTHIRHILSGQEDGTQK